MVIENSIYVGKVKHKRFSPKPHQFEYNIFMFFFDISQIPRAFKTTKWFSIERFNWFSFKRANHLGVATEPLDYSVRQHIKEKTDKLVEGKIYLLTHLTTLGYCFNPISVYVVFKPSSNEIEMVLMEVTNTPWGEQHVYILDTPEVINNTYRYTFEKFLHVSPFMQMNYQYQINFKIDNSQLILHIDSLKENERHFEATLSLNALALNKRNIKAMMLRFPFITYKVTASIYWEALKLFLKGIPFYTHPKG